jgi:hypothetical protein
LVQRQLGNQHARGRFAQRLGSFRSDGKALRESRDDALVTQDKFAKHGQRVTWHVLSLVIISL